MKKFYCNGKKQICEHHSMTSCAICQYGENGGYYVDLDYNTVNVVLDEGAILPTRAHDLDAGYDLYSRESVVIYHGDSHCFDTGVHIAIPAGYVGMVKSKSGLNVKYNLTSEGVIDSGYTGSIVVKLYNHGNAAVAIEKGQKISQLVILPIATPKLIVVEELEDTARGGGGFGSTGAF